MDVISAVWGVALTGVVFVDKRVCSVGVGVVDNISRI